MFPAALYRGTADEITMVRISIDELCNAAVSPAPRQRRDCEMARASGANDIGYVLGTGKDD
jgi:hypothetical protein